MAYEEGEKPKEIILGSILVVIGFNALLLGIAFLPLESIDFLSFFLPIGLGIGVVGTFLPNLKLTKNTIAYIKSTIQRFSSRHISIRKKANKPSFF